MQSDPSDAVAYQVVINDEEQYSIWPVDKSIPIGWHAVGPMGVKSDCLKYIDDVWTDMRPLSLRRLMAENDARELSIKNPLQNFEVVW